MILDGKRSTAEQEGHVARGASKTKNSRHLYGYAVDFGVLVNGKLRWEAAYYKIVGAYFKQAAIQLRIPMNWGGDWARFRDWGHVELARSAYPDKPELVDA